MAHDDLEQLLRSADASAPAPPVVAELPARVRRRQARRRMRDLASAAVAALLLPLLVMAMFTRTSPRPQVVIKPDVPPASHELAELELQAALHEQTAAHLLAAQTATSPTPLVTDHDLVLVNVRQQRDRAALILIYEADHAARQKQTDRALAAYRRTIELFPRTYWAGVARQRLKEMPT